jgi:hypothetical protein
MRNYILLITLIIFSGCNLLTTREPENPDSGRSTFQPPTSASVVISNFTNSIKEKNADNYISCLSDSVNSYDAPFNFIASADANSRYPALFQNWRLASERATFVNMISYIQKNDVPVLDLQNSRFDVLQPDSAIYISDYSLQIKINLDTVSTKYSGTMQLVIIRRNNGLWHIDKWYDQNKNSDSIANTWSILKAVFSH